MVDGTELRSAGCRQVTRTSLPRCDYEPLTQSDLLPVMLSMAQSGEKRCTEKQPCPSDPRAATGNSFRFMRFHLFSF
jgi:hypothetical protein